MITTAKIKNGSTYLGHHLTANDYYTEKESVSGEWIGKGAQLLEIEGKRIFAATKSSKASGPTGKHWCAKWPKRAVR